MGSIMDNSLAKVRQKNSIMLKFRSQTLTKNSIINFCFDSKHELGLDEKLTNYVWFNFRLQKLFQTICEKEFDIPMSG